MNDINKLTYWEKVDIYKEVLADYTAQDIIERSKEFLDDKIDAEEAKRLGRLWAYEGRYDCNLSYWGNIDNLILNYKGIAN